MRIYKIDGNNVSFTRFIRELKEAIDDEYDDEFRCYIDTMNHVEIEGIELSAHEVLEHFDDFYKTVRYKYMCKIRKTLWDSLLKGNEERVMCTTFKIVG